ncbi:flagellar motor protein MotB [Sphingomonas sp. PvP018]|uniref:flagellar motor protein MotB n=1 Tax=Sphingomonas sp. PvP018 TaxID=2817852 RepID=UPI001AE2D5E3|nr:flagellar motor protein MotB [Sphingomonas sp. PvP018]MBP2513676.1 hypothetical protein [Sphingomonas sp. PvP018]
MTVGDYPEPQPGRPLWLITLADLALLLVGFFVLLQATQTASDRPLAPRALAAGLREGFGASVTPTVDTARPKLPVPGGPLAAAQPTALPVAAAGMLDFAVGSAVLPTSPDTLATWARDAVQDPRVQLTVTGSVDGSPGDVDPVTHSAAILASDRARAVAAAIAHVAPGRVTLATSPTTGRRAAIVTQAFVGEPPRTPS